MDISPLEDCILGVSGCSNPSGGNAFEFNEFILFGIVVVDELEVVYVVVVVNAPAVGEFT